ncbi:unnamed protein product [Gordionus sp. m RMFG-2023]
MMKIIRESYNEELDNSIWLDNETKQFMKDKLKAMHDKIGYTNALINTSSYDNAYKELIIKPGEFLQNYIRGKMFQNKILMLTLKKPYDKDTWDFPPVTVNAYYKANANEMVFPAGILQEPLFYSDLPTGYNFGALGFVIAHELIHGFDVIGSQFDKFGNIKKWKNKNFIDEFNYKTQCLKDQYSNYTFNGEMINGKLTIAENIADNGGIRTAYKVETL